MEAPCEEHLKAAVGPWTGDALQGHEALPGVVTAEDYASPTALSPGECVHKDCS